RTRGRLGKLELPVNNAGMSQPEPRAILDATEESFDELIGVNLKGPHFLTQLAARWMVEQRSGRIVFITSISSYTASVNRAEYCISKAGLSMSVALYAPAPCRRWNTGVRDSSGNYPHRHDLRRGKNL